MKRKCPTSPNTHDPLTDDGYCEQCDAEARGEELARYWERLTGSERRQQGLTDERVAALAAWARRGR